MNWNLLPQLYGDPLTVYHLHRYKTGTELLIFPSCHRLPHKN